MEESFEHVEHPGAEGGDDIQSSTESAEILQLSASTSIEIMNCRSLELELHVTKDQVEEAVRSIIHPALFYRSKGKILYESDQKMRVGTLGYMDVTATYIDTTYMKVNSPTLDVATTEMIQPYVTAMKLEENKTGKISIEFYEKKPGPWRLTHEKKVAWEIWSLTLHKVPDKETDAEKLSWKIKVGQDITKCLQNMIKFFNDGEYLPAPPKAAFVDNVYDTSFTDCQPYLFNIRHSFSNDSASSFLRKLSIT